MIINNKLLQIFSFFPVKKYNAVVDFDYIHFRKGNVFIQDDENILSFNIPECDMEFSILFSYLKEVLSYLKKAKEIELQFIDNKISICDPTKKKSVFSYPCKTLDLIEKIEYSVKEYQVIPLENYRDIIQKAMAFVKKDPLRPQLEHVYCCPSFIGATNAHILYVKTISTITGQGGFFHCDFTKFLPYSKALLTSEKINQIELSVSNYTGQIITQQFGKFPDIYKVIPDTKISGTLGFSGKELVEDNKIFSKINSEMVKVFVTDKEITFMAENIDNGKEYKNSYKLMLNNGVRGRFAVKPDFLKIVLDSIDTSLITIQVTDSNRILKFNDVYIMPVMLSDDSSGGELTINGYQHKELEKNFLAESARKIMDCDELPNGLYKFVWHYSIDGVLLKTDRQYKVKDGSISTSYVLDSETHTLIDIDVKTFEVITAHEKTSSVAKKEEEPKVTDDERCDVLTAENEETNDFPDAIATCPSCGVKSIVSEKNTFRCLYCSMETPRTFVKRNDAYVCPVCDNSMEYYPDHGEGELLICAHCHLMLFPNEFTPSEKPIEQPKVIVETPTIQSYENDEPRKECSKCRKYEWTDKIVDGLCVKCQKERERNKTVKDEIQEQPGKENVPPLNVLEKKSENVDKTSIETTQQSTNMPWD